MEQYIRESLGVENEQKHFVCCFTLSVQYAREKWEIFVLQEKWASLPSVSDSQIVDAN